ncbi:MAG: 5-(carboxyamino)imidazole ribonucleotide synthase [Deltaproteobacteria bacterium]|nr:5-(carboxyamino)imidazole ribonucleotide synthase [Deltaproteobacteria bacterium]
MTPLVPGATIGVLGGGQLGRMLAVTARQMGYRIVVLDPSARCPTAQVSDGVVVGALDDLDCARHLARQVDVITLDTEHVPADLLADLETIVPVRPGAAVLRTIQDRLVQKQFLDGLGLPQAAWGPASDVAELEAALARVGRPAILKVRRAGYDGKGQYRIEPGDDAALVIAKLRGEPAVVEELVPYVREVSVVLARGVDGAHRIYPIAENAHRRHILHTTRAPAPMPDAQRKRAEDIAVTVADSLAHVGVMAVEMFELADDRLLVNEIAPRTHNSGHYTYGACATSQFEQHVRAVCGLPLGDPRSLTGAVMVNLIGDLWAKGSPPWQHVLDRPDARLHLYGKDLPAPGRKMGHVLLLDDDTDGALATADALIARLGGMP